MTGAATWAAAAIAILLALVAGAFLLRRKAGAGKSAPQNAQAQPPPDPAPSPSSARMAAGTRWEVRPKDLVDFFLAIYKVQLGVQQTAPTEVVPVREKSVHGALVFEFKVNRKGKWVQRRMSIRPIGEESKSRSRLYYVIFDAHLVVKVTPRPVTDFSRYLEQIKKEWGIARTLAPRECVVPLLSVILRLVQPLAAGKDRSVEAIEDLYIKKATHQTELRGYLKIGGGFLYFMELSTRFFLSEVLRDIHDPEDRLFDEMTACPQLLTDPFVGSGRYGEESLPACLGIQSAFVPCRDSVAAGFKLLPENPQVPHRLNQWFLECVAGRCPSRESTGLSAAAWEVVEAAIKNTMKDHPFAVGSFSEAVSVHVKRLSFSQSRSKLEGIATALLDLLAWLGKCNVAARDLKPDNLLVVGDPARYPGFLTNPQDFEIGLIDLETAVCWTPQGGGPPPEPPPAGTPLYATPAHMMDNGLLTSLFSDLGTSLHMEDWYATVGMIFFVATGEPLFTETARGMSTVIQILRSPVTSMNDPVHFAREALRFFWESAFSDFSAKMAAKGQVLESLSIKMGKNTSEMISSHLTAVRDRLRKEMEAYVESRAGSSSAESRQKLLAATSVSLARRIEAAGNDPATAFLARLRSLKRREEALERILSAPDDPVNARDLLEAMFYRVFAALYDESWGVLAIS